MVTDLELGQTNGATSGTEIQGKDPFLNSYVFQANATYTRRDRYIDGLHGLGIGAGGVVGMGGAGPGPYSGVDDIDSSSDDTLARGQGVL